MSEPLKYTDTKQPEVPILFFIHGWPDSAALWEKQVEFFSKDYRCICVTLPAFAAGDNSKGADFPDLVQRLQATLLEVSAGTQPDITVVGHDWGAFLTYLLDQRYPNAARRLITMDVGGRLQPTALGHIFFILAYQWWLVAAHWIAKLFPFLGNAMTKTFATIAKAPAASEAQAKMNYLYFYFWRAKFFKKYGAALPNRYRPSKPILYLYGMAKKYHFHSPRWEEIVAETPGSQVIGMPNCDHWLMVRAPEATNAIMKKWLG